jgi:hypothetical protein
MMSVPNLPSSPLRSVLLGLCAAPIILFGCASTPPATPARSAPPAIATQTVLQSGGGEPAANASAADATVETATAADGLVADSSTTEEAEELGGEGKAEGKTAKQDKGKEKSGSAKKKDSGKSKPPAKNPAKPKSSGKKK